MLLDGEDDGFLQGEGGGHECGQGREVRGHQVKVGEDGGGWRGFGV